MLLTMLFQLHRLCCVTCQVKIITNDDIQKFRRN